MRTILFLYHTSSIGGGSFCLLNILKALDRSKFNPIVLLCYPGPLTDEIEKLGIEVQYMKYLVTVPYNSSTLTPKKFINAIKIIYGLHEFKKLLKRLTPDIVYINTMMLYPFLKPAREMNCKTVMHIREHWPENEHPVQRRIALKHIEKYSNQVIAINSFSKSLISNKEVLVDIVYDWIDMSNRYEDVSMSEIFNEYIDGNKIYLYLGGMQSIKGALEVANTFSKIIRDKNARLLMMGIELNNKANSGIRGLVKRIFSFFGYKTYSQKVLFSIAKDSRIKTIPSRYKLNNIIEQSYCLLSYFTIPHANLALAESIILGTPMIAARTPESLEYSDNGSLSSLFNFNDLKDFENHVHDFDIERESLVMRIRNGSDKISRMFDPQINIVKLNQILNKM